MDAFHFLQYGLALVFVLALIGTAALAARRLGLARALPSAGRRRLGVLEMLPLDAKRRLVLLRRDGIEHLVILGPTGETVVERAIGAAAGSFGAELRSRLAAEPGAEQSA
jgi:flagellar protein FliO/FliZ